MVTEFREAPEPLAGRSRPEIYENLLCEFRREHAARSKGSIILQLFDDKKFELEQKLRPKEILYCGSTVLEQKLTPIGEKWNPWCDTFRVVCIPYPFIALSDSERAQHDTDPVSAWEKFSTLATQAGAHLSVGIRKTMLSCEGQPLANWLQLMFCTLRPKIELERAYGNRCNLSHMPFADAADVIELCRLNTNEPILPPLLQERKGRIDAIPEAPVLSKGEETKNSTKKVRKRGRRSDTDHDEDKKIFDAWKTGRHKTYGALAKDRGKNEKGKNIALAIDRHRHRTNRGNAS